MVSSSPQDEKQKNLKYKLKELVIRFTYHSSHVPFWLASNKTCGTLRSTAKMSQRLLCFIFVVFEIAIFVDDRCARKQLYRP